MATKNRLMCYKSSLVLITDKRIVHIFHLSTDEIYNEIDNVIKKEKTIPTIQIFKKSIENLLPGNTFGDIRRKKCIYGEEISIYDTMYYRKFEQYIQQKRDFKTILKKNKQRKDERIQYMKSEKIFNSYHMERIRKERKNARR